MTEQKTIVSAKPTVHAGQLFVLIVFKDGDWTFWQADSHKDVQAIVELVGETVDVEIQEVIASGTLH